MDNADNRYCWDGLREKIPRGRIQQWSCLSTASWLHPAVWSPPEQRQLFQNRNHMLRFLKRNVNEVICFSFVRSSIGRHFSKVKSRFLLLNLTSDKGSLLLKPVTNGSDGRNIHKPETKPADNPVRDLWMVGGLTKGKGRRTHHQDVDVGREGWHKDCCGRDTSSSCEKKDWVLISSSVFPIYQCMLTGVQTCSPGQMISVQPA